MCMVTASTLPTLHVLYPAASASDVLNHYQQHCTLHSLQALADMLVEVCKNPKSPGFNHYLFESVAALIKHGTAADPAQMSTYEATLFPAFQIVLSNDVQEFHPYVFQIFAQLIELSNPPLSAVGTAVPIPECQHSLGDDLIYQPPACNLLAAPGMLHWTNHPHAPCTHVYHFVAMNGLLRKTVPLLSKGDVTCVVSVICVQPYMAVFPPLLTPVFWERHGNIPALTRLLVAYLAKAGQEIIAAGHLPPMLGVFQKLVASKANDQYGFALISAIVQHLPLASYQQFMPTVWQLLFTRLQVGGIQGTAARSSSASSTLLWNVIALYRLMHHMAACFEACYSPSSQQTFAAAAARMVTIVSFTCAGLQDP